MTQETIPFPHIRALLFDFDGTLRHNDPPAHHFFFDQAVTFGAAESHEKRSAALRWAHSYWNGNGDVYLDIEKFGQDTNEFWLNHAYRYLLAFGCPLEQAEALAPRMRAYMNEKYSPVNSIEPGAVDLLQDLRAAGYILAVVSNRDEPYVDILEAIGLADCFDFSLAAGEVDSWKPDPVIFFQALKKAGVRADEAVYIGDNYYADVIGARVAGIHPVLFDMEGVFPEADCTTVANLAQLAGLFLDQVSA